MHRSPARHVEVVFDLITFNVRAVELVGLKDFRNVFAGRPILDFASAVHPRY